MTKMQLENIYAIGGQQKKLGHNQTAWHAHGKGVIVKINARTGIVQTCLEYVTPPELCPDKDPSILFKAGTIIEDTLYACTTTEVLIYKLPAFEQIGFVSLPCFNDVHHVYPTPEGNLLVAVTGLDMVVETTPQGEVLQEWNVLGQDPWERFDPAVDYRKVLTTKPHHSHPNFVFQVGDDIWVTRFEQKDAICLTQPDRHIDIGVERLHDGIVYGSKVYFTAVDGHIIVANLENEQVENIVNLNDIANEKNRALGWCRSLYVIDEDHVIVGFSRLRPTKFRENLRWVRRQLGDKVTGNAPTRISLFNLKQKKLIWEYSLEEAGINAIFSVHVVP